MVANYLIIFLRLLQRQKLYAAINVIGLGVGIAATLLIAFYITDELSYDTFYPDGDRMYRVSMHWKINVYDGDDAFTPALLAEELQRNVTGIESVIRLNFWKPTPLRVSTKVIVEDKIMLADSNFFDFFAFPLIAGNPATALSGPNKIVLTPGAARKYFGYEAKDPREFLGKIIQVGDKQQAMEVTGIVGEAPGNSHFHFNAIVSISTLPPMKYWTSTRGDYTYFKRHVHVPVEVIEAQFPGLIKTYFEPELIQVMKKSLSELHAQGEGVHFFSQPIADIHLYSHGDNEIEANSSMSYLYLIGSIAGLIILLACINFINLSTARAQHRAKEIGIRKLVGAVRAKLLRQHLLESYLYTTLAFLLALSLVSLALTPFSVLTSKHVTLSALGKPENLLTCLCLFAVIGLLAGAYPAIYLTQFKPIEALKKNFISIGQFSGLRNGLVTAQFIISITLILSSITIYQQIQLLLEKDLGFNKERVLYSMNASTLGHNRAAFTNELHQHSEIIASSFVTRPFTDLNLWTLNHPATGQWIDFYHNRVDYNTSRVLDFRMVKGRYFSPEFPSDSSAIIINETAANHLGITDLANKQTLSSVKKGVTTEHTIIGIVKDINFQSLKHSIKPMAFSLGGNANLLVRIAPGETQDKIQRIEGIWQKYTEAPFEYGFLDDQYAALYKDEQKLGQIAFVFSSLAVVIACLGLFGLVTYIASQRTKEIGIRKVLGASVQQVVMLLSKDFVKLVLVALLIAMPTAWYGMNQWLSTFAYRTDLNLLTCLAVGAGVMLISLSTISYQSIRAAMSNPVDSLRSE